MIDLSVDIYEPRDLARALIVHYHNQTSYCIDVSFSFTSVELRAWLEVVDEIDVLGYDPRRVMKHIEFGLSPFVWQNRAAGEVRTTIRMALSIWTRGYLTAKAGAA